MKFKGIKGGWFVNDLDDIFISSEENKVTIAKIYGANWQYRELRANALLISKAPEMLERLYQQNIDLKVLYGHMLDIEKTNNRADGMSVLIQKWIDENEQLIKEATEL